jgi:hypothetical protein
LKHPGFLEGKAMKRVVMGIALLLLTTSVWAGTLRDNFDDGDMDEWVAEPIGANGKWEIKAGELVITPQACPVPFRIGEKTWENYTVRVRARIEKHQTTASGWIEGLFITARQLLEEHTYLFGLGTRGLSGKMAYALYMQGKDTMHFVSEPFEWELNKWHDLKVTAEGDQFWFYVDNRLVIHYTDDTYAKGYVGIGSGYRQTTVHFDDFSVTGDDVPDLNLDVSPEVKLATTWGQVKG